MLKELFKKVTQIFVNSGKQADKFFRNAIEIAAASADKIKVVPVGVFPVHPDGPHEITFQHIQEMANNIMASGTDILFDFGHESLWSSSAEAAAWSPRTDVEARPDGLYIKYPEFTTKGQEKVNSKAYRYFSPAYFLVRNDKNGKEIGAVLHSIGLVNKPYMDHEIDHIGNSNNFKKNNSEGNEMNKALLKFLGLADTATDAEVQAAIKANCTKYGLAETATIGELIEKAEAQAKTNSAATVPADYETIKNENAAFKQAEETRVAAEAEALVNSAIEKGKLLPALKDQTIADAKKNFAAVKADLDKRADNSAVPAPVEIPTGKTFDVNDPNAIANAARTYIAEQKKLGIDVSYSAAVNAVLK